MNQYFEKHVFPDELKRMTEDELELLSFEVRDFLVESVSKTGGHLASNLGAVELTIALLKVFDPPHDKILWDVGHQSYVYKLLTGRYQEFENLRQLDGMSGFPRAKESVYDVFDTGHASTSISLGQGLAKARDLKGESYQVISVIGDGAMTGGIAFEALNNMANNGSKQIIILNDNGMSIAPNNSGLSSYLGKIRRTRKYNDLKNTVKNRLARLPLVGMRMVSGIHNTKETIKFAVIEDGMIFEELGLKYFGPIDGHNISDLCEVLELARDVNGPTIIHINTMKGKGYTVAEENPDVFHGIGPFDMETGAPLRASQGPTYSSIFGSSLEEMAKEDNRIVAISAAMLDGTGLSGFADKFPKRTFDVGIAEGHAVTFAAGLAKAGMRPYVAVYSTFMQRAYDQIVEDVCLQELPVVFCLDRAGVVGADGETHQGILDLSYLSAMPQITIMAPKDGAELQKMLKLSQTLDGPCAIRYPRGTAPELNDAPLEMGKAERIKDGTDLAIWAIGFMVETALKAAQLLEEQGISAAVYNARFCKPLDEETLLASADQTGRIVTLEDNILSGGLGEQIDAILVNHTAEVLNLSWPDRFIEHGTIGELHQRYGLDAASVAERIRKELESKA